MTIDNKAMAKTDNEATAINSNFDESTQIVDPTASPSEEAIEREEGEGDASMPAAGDRNSSHKTAKIVGGIAVGSAVLGTAASVINDIEDESTGEMPAVEEEEENEYITENVIELPEITVEAVRPGHESPGNDGKIHSGDNTLTAEPVYAEALGVKPEETYQTPTSLSDPEETISSQTVTQTEEDLYGDDIPIVSVGNAGDGDIQILGVTQDISTGYNVGHLSVDGEEVVVIDVDGDMVFDSMVVDVNHDGDITADEIIDIRQQSLTLDDFGKTSDIDVNPLDNSGDIPDYLSEM